jgi:hypothetical protein
LALVVVALASLTLGVRTTGAAQNPANECLIGLKDTNDQIIPDRSTTECTDGDSCDADGATDGTCVFRIMGCVNIPGVEGCALRPVKKARFVTPNSNDEFVVTPVSGEPSSVCSAFVDFHVPLKKKGKKDGKRKINSSFKSTQKPPGENKDADKNTFVCKVCGSQSCVPPTTTSTSTTTVVVSTTTSTTSPCGNGTIDPGETCDPDAAPNGCSGGTPYCNPTTCAACQASCSGLAFTLGLPTQDCGFPGQGAPASPPLSGQLLDGSDMPITNGELGLACLYIGGGLASIVPPGPTPDGSTTIIGIANCSVNNVTLEPAATGNPATCTVGLQTTKHCVNGHPGTDGQGSCSSDADCGPVCVNNQCIDGAGGLDGMGMCNQNNHCGVSSADNSDAPVGTCLPDAACFFGNPLPIDNAGTSTCVLNVINDGVGGTADVSAGTADVTMPLQSRVYLTGVEPDFADGTPCPICDNGTCDAGPRKGQACTTNSSLKTTLDCPPPAYDFLAPLGVTLSPLTTSQAVLTSDMNGIFCPSQANGGAFGLDTVRKIVENGSPAAGGFDVTGKATTLGSAFCIPATNSLLIDGAANLPGPGATGLGGTARLR